MAVEVEYRWIRQEDADRLLNENGVIECVQRDSAATWPLVQIERHQEHRNYQSGVTRLLVITPALPNAFGPDRFWAAVHYEAYRDEAGKSVWSYTIQEEDEAGTNWILFQSVQSRAVVQVQYVGYSEEVG